MMQPRGKPDLKKVLESMRTEFRYRMAGGDGEAFVDELGRAIDPQRVSMPPPGDGGSNSEEANERDDASG